MKEARCLIQHIGQTKNGVPAKVGQVTLNQCVEAVARVKKLTPHWVNTHNEMPYLCCPDLKSSGYNNHV